MLEIWLFSHLLEANHKCFASTLKAARVQMSDDGSPVMSPGHHKDMILDLFRKFDNNCDGYIDREELIKIFAKISPDSFTHKKVEQIFKVVDVNHDGMIDYKEFVDWLMNGSPSKKPQRMSDAPGLDYRTWLPQRFQVDIAKRYALDKLEIGIGCYGKVFVAKDREFADRTVAVKRVTKTMDIEANEQFYEEVKIMKALDHPNICKLLGTFEQGRHFFFIMEYCSGGELFDHIVKQGHIDEAKSADIVGQVTSALYYAHGRSIAHRDLKPENVVFFTDDPTDNLVKLIDWGLGISFASGRMQAAVGSRLYAAPEVTSSRNVKAYTSACDLWSLGVLTYVMLCGKPPFSGSGEQRFEQAMQEKYDMSGSIWDAVSDNAKDFVTGLIKTDPKERLPIDIAAMHPWLCTKHLARDNSVDLQVLTNIREFADQSICAAVCVTAVAKHLNHQGLRDIHEVFRRLDRNGDGVLSLDEIKIGFRDIFGADSKQYKEVEKAFGSMDIDHSGFIDYTEFCAAGLGEQASQQEDAIWAAFKAFDYDNTGRISQEELRTVLQNADVNHAWTPWVCEAAVQEFIQKFDEDGDGYIEFDEFLAFMRRNWGGSRDLEMDMDPTTSMTFSPTLSCFTSSMELREFAAGRTRSDGNCTRSDGASKPSLGAWAYELLTAVAGMPTPRASPQSGRSRHQAPSLRCVAEGEADGSERETSGDAEPPLSDASTEAVKEDVGLPIPSKKKAASLPIVARSRTDDSTVGQRKLAAPLPIVSKKHSYS